MAGYDWPAAEAAITSWISAATGLQPLWAWQLTEYPTSPVCVVDFSRLRPVDRREVRSTFDAGKPNGEEFQVTTHQFYEATMNLTFMTSQNQLLGAVSPHALAARAQTYLQQEAQLEALDAAGLGFVELGDIEKDPELFKNTWRPNAVAEVRFYMSESVVKGIGYIATATVEWTNAPKPALEDMAISTVVP
jgi:hypothetical protein